MSSKAKPAINRRSFLKALGGTAFGVGFVGALGWKYAREVEPNLLQVESVSIPLPSLPSDAQSTRLICLSDFHLHPYTQIGLIQECVRIVNRLDADLVCLLGDYVFERADSIFELAPVLAKISARLGVYAVLGNHDLWTDPGLVASTLEQEGIPVFENEHITLDLADGELVLAGLQDGWSGHPDLDAALHGVPDELPVVLMMHEPDFADQYKQDSRVDLQLSGHSHGGQVRLPGIGAPFLPQYGQKYDQGLFEPGGMLLYTTRGIGVIGPPLRFNCRPEISMLTLHPSSGV